MSIRPFANHNEWVFLSDVHFNEVKVESEEGWWPYKQPENAQDNDLEDFFLFIERQRPSYFKKTTIVFAGDTFDFDTCYAVPPGAPSSKEGLRSTREGAAFKMSEILKGHPRFLTALSRFLAKGNTVVFMFGNHDRELHFPEVQDILIKAVAEKAPLGQAETVAKSVHFEPWFLYEPGLFFVEHGNQYDATCSYRNILLPLVPESKKHPLELETPFGSVLGRYTLSRLGTFNPYDDESFILSLGGYVQHWHHFYFPKKPFARAYVRATWKTVAELQSQKRRQYKHDKESYFPHEEQALFQNYAKKKGVSPHFIRQLLKLTSRPISDKLRHLLHEVWLDRFGFLAVALTLLAYGTTRIESLSQVFLLLLFIPTIVWIMKAMGRGSLALQERARWALVAETIASHVDVPIIAFGHSHRPERRRLSEGRRYYNLGSWAPLSPSESQSSLVSSRRYLIIRKGQSDAPYVAFSEWKRKNFLGLPAAPSDPRPLLKKESHEA